MQKTGLKTFPDRSVCNSAKRVLSETDGGTGKHHILWTVSEVRKLVDGVSQCGVGRWAQIKRLVFSSYAHRSPVDLKVTVFF